MRRLEEKPRCKCEHVYTPLPVGVAAQTLLATQRHALQTLYELASWPTNCTRSC